MKKSFVILVVLLIVGLLGWQIYQKISSSQKKRPHRGRRNVAVAVEITPTRKMTIRDVGSFTGTLTPRSQFIVAPKIAGRVEKIMVNIGDYIERGQLITVLDDDEYVQKVDQARAELEVARANLEESRIGLGTARRELKRARALRKKKIASEAELDSAQAQVRAQNAKDKVALAQVSYKKASLKAAQVRLSYTKIRASWEKDGHQRVVGERFVDEGAMLAPNNSIVSVLDISSLIAVIHVIERDYSKVRIGQEASVTTDAYPGRTFSGKIIRLAPLLKETSRQARVEVEIPNQENLLKPGMFIRVKIEFTRHKGATVIPRGVLINRNGRQGVFLADTQEMKAHFVPVTLGIVNGESVEVIRPVLSGPIVSLGQHLLEEGSTIILPGAKPVRPRKKSDGGRGSGRRPGGRP